MTNRDDSSDHHLNMISRLCLIPPTLRGNQLRKYLAFLYLQTLTEVVHCALIGQSYCALIWLYFQVDQRVLPENVNVDELTNSLELCESLGPGLKLLVSQESKHFCHIVF